MYEKPSTDKLDRPLASEGVPCMKAALMKEQEELEALVRKQALMKEREELEALMQKKALLKEMEELEALMQKKALMKELEELEGLMHQRMDAMELKRSARETSSDDMKGMHETQLAKECEPSMHEAAKSFPAESPPAISHVLRCFMHEGLMHVHLIMHAS